MAGLPNQKDTAAYYKKRLLWCLALAAPGVLFWVFAAVSTQNGGGEAFIVFIPFFLLTFFCLFAAFLYGIAYVYKKFKESV